MNTAHAYLLLGVDIKTHQLIALDIFSESNPTINNHVRVFTALTGYGVDYTSAIRDLKSRLFNDPFNAWMHPLLSERAKRSLADA